MTSDDDTPDASCIFLQCRRIEMVWMQVNTFDNSWLKSRSSHLWHLNNTFMNLVHDTFKLIKAVRTKI